MSHKNLADDINFLLRSASVLIEDNKIIEAQAYLDKVIDKDANNEHAYHLRAQTFSKTHDWSAANKDIMQTLKINPDDASNYFSLAVNITYMVFDAKPKHLGEHKESIQTMIDLYRECLERDPSYRAAWFNMAETHLFLRQWDDAIAIQAQCKSFVTDKANQVTHAWIGCLALALAGDEILDEDSQILFDQSIQFTKDFHDTSQIDLLLTELKNDNFDYERLTNARQIHDAFLNHIDYSYVNTTI